MRRLNDQEELKVALKFVNSATIAKKHWGDAEKEIVKVFSSNVSCRRVILLDDLECLFLDRGSNIVREYHFAINSVLFHELDKLNPARTLVLATTNRPDLVDDALRSRLHILDVHAPPLEVLSSVLEALLAKCWPLWVDPAGKVDAHNDIMGDVGQCDFPSFRTLQNLLVQYCITNNVWERAREVERGR